MYLILSFASAGNSSGSGLVASLTLGPSAAVVFPIAEAPAAATFPPALAAPFGSLGFAGAYTVGGSSPTRGIFMGGEAPSIQNRIDYITIATTGDATDFGDLTQTTTRHAGTSSHTRGISMGGTNPSASNVISYVTISTTGNATDFGDLSSAEKWFSACSDVHGGLE